MLALAAGSTSWSNVVLFKTLDYFFPMVLLMDIQKALL